MRLAVLAGMVMMLMVLPGQADDDHERARQLRQRGEVLPLTEVIERLQQRQPGRVLEVELEREQGRWVYEIEMLAEDGAVWEYQLDAASGELLERERDH